MDYGEERVPRDPKGGGEGRGLGEEGSENPGCRLGFQLVLLIGGVKAKFWPIENSRFTYSM